MASPQTQNGKRSRTLTMALFASLGAHLAALPFLHVAASARPAPPSPHVLHLDPPRPTPVPIAPPSSTPRPHIVQATHPQPRPPHAVAIVPPKTHTQSPNTAREQRRATDVHDTIASTPGNAHGDARVPADPGVTGAPGNAATAAPATATTPDIVPEQRACAASPREAHVIDAVTPERPAIAAEEGATGRVEVRVDLAPSGAVAEAALYKSSGNAALDAAAIEAARRSTYEAASDGCGPIAGSYIFTVDYSD